MTMRKDREDSIAQYLSEKMGRNLVLGKTLFVNNMPATVTSGVLVKASYAGATRDPYIRGLHTERFQIVVRSPSDQYDKCKTLAYKIMEILDIHRDVKIKDGITIKMCRASTTPISYKVSNGSNSEVSTNYQIIYFS